MEFSDVVALKIKELMQEKNISTYGLESLTGVYSSTITLFLNRKTKTKTSVKYSRKSLIPSAFPALALLRENRYNEETKTNVKVKKMRKGGRTAGCMASRTV